MQPILHVSLDLPEYHVIARTVLSRFEEMPLLGKAVSCEAVLNFVGFLFLFESCPSRHSELLYDCLAPNRGYFEH